MCVQRGGELVTQYQQRGACSALPVGRCEKKKNIGCKQALLAAGGQHPWRAAERHGEGQGDKAPSRPPHSF